MFAHIRDQQVLNINPLELRPICVKLPPALRKSGTKCHSVKYEHCDEYLERMIALRA